MERSKDIFSCYAENIEGIYGCGETIADAKQSIIDAISLFKKYNAYENIPEILQGEYAIVYKFDVFSFLNYYKGVFYTGGIRKNYGH